MKTIIEVFLCALLFCSCARNTEVLELEKCRNYRINIQIAKEIWKDSLTCFKIASGNNLKIVKAFYACDKKTTRNFSLKDSSLVDCKNFLLIIGDTVEMWATYSQLGKIKFDDVTLIMSDENSDLSFIDTTFYFHVSQTPPVEKLNVKKY
jgi:hypothetical protein